MRVRVFRNLHKKCMSIIAMEGSNKGRVIAHANSAYLHNCKMVVYETSRQKVIKSRQKNVHAFVEGILQCADLITLRYTEDNLSQGVTDHPHPVHIRYNPYERGEYYYTASGDPVWAVKCAEVRPDGVWTEA